MQLDFAHEGGAINTGNPVLPNNFDPEVLLKYKHPSTDPKVIIADG